MYLTPRLIARCLVMRKRRFEAPLAAAEALLDALVTEMIKRMDKPFAFFGRELGLQARPLSVRVASMASTGLM